MNTYEEYKNSKINLLNKLSKFSSSLSRSTKGQTSKKKENTFISINDYFADTLSDGPYADPGTINYSFYSFENINNYIRILIDELGYHKIVCMPSFLTRHNSSVIRNAINYNNTYDFLLIDEQITNEIEACKSKRFVYIILTIMEDMYNFGHSNMLIIDNYKNTIERFEPYGESFFNGKNVNKRIDKKFSKKLLAELNLNNFSYISPTKISPKIGLQSKADAYDGLCVTYSLIYLQLRLMNPDINQKIIIKYLLSKKKNQIISIILRYAKFVEQKLKENRNMILRESHKLYNIDIHKIKNFILVNDKGIESITL